MGCRISSVECRRADTPIHIDTSREHLEVELSSSRVATAISVSSGVICEIVVEKYQLFKVKYGGVLRLKNGGRFKVLKKREL